MSKKTKKLVQYTEKCEKWLEESREWLTEHAKHVGESLRGMATDVNKNDSHYRKRIRKLESRVLLLEERSRVDVMMPHTERCSCTTASGR